MSHLSQLIEALREEAQWTRRELERLGKGTRAEQLAVGFAWPDAKVVLHELERRGRELCVIEPVGEGVFHDQITVGTPVSIGAAGGEARWGAWVDSVSSRQATLRLVEPVEELPPVVFVCKRWDPTEINQQIETLEACEETPSLLAKSLLGQRTVSQDATLGLMGEERGDLNEAQAKALAVILASEGVSAVHGPPGTGKTHLLLRTLVALVQREGRALGAAESNAGVDHITRGLMKTSLRVVRLGHPERMSADVRSVSVEHLMEAHGLAPVMKGVRDEIKRCWSKSEPGIRRKRRELQKELRGLRTRVIEEILADAQVITGTLSTLRRRKGRLPEVKTAVIDEATQATEPAVWGLVSAVERLILFGDPEQLGPVVLQPGNLLERSLMQRLVEEGVVGAPMLEVQHRMSAGLQALVGPVYGDAYRPHPSVNGATLRERYPEVSVDGPFFVDTAGAGLHDERDPLSSSMFNRGEARLVQMVVRQWLEAGLRPDDIGVIAPYRAQVAELRRLEGMEGIEVDSVNAFQGREKEAIVVSFVRSNPEGEIGFVSDGRRLTVAATRGRRAWVGIGDSATLSRYGRYEELLTILEEAGAVHTVWEEPWIEALQDDESR